MRRVDRGLRDRRWRRGRAPGRPGLLALDALSADATRTEASGRGAATSGVVACRCGVAVVLARADGGIVWR
jgi:hypothetical protein